jgi:type II secretory pathway pseudopilin PulG
VVPSASVSLPPPRRARQAGFTFLEVLIAAIILVVSALGFASSVGTGHVLAVRVDDRSLAMETLQRLVERVRADPDWDGLYARLKALTQESAGDTALTKRDVDLTLTTYPMTTYYSDLVAPTKLGTVTALIQVPVTTVGGVGDLRENAVAPRYGLPYDLNGDGVIDGDPRSDDYRSLPLVVRLRWQRLPRAAEELVLATWPRGDR